MALRLSILILNLLSLATAIPNIPRQSTGLERCINSTFTDVITRFNGKLASVYTSDTEPYTPQVLFYAKSLGVPDVCGVRINVTATIAFEMYLPTPTKWNRRFLAVGNSAFDGGTSRYDMFSRALHGWAVMSTNTGHETAGLAWALNNSEAQKDWAYRAMAQSLPFAKAVAAAYYGSVTPVGNYYAGCSTGGRQGIRQIQEDAASFDGMLIGAPAWNVKSAMPVISRIGWLAKTYGLLETSVQIPLISRIAQRVYDQCNPLDNVTTDSAVRDSAACLNLFLSSGVNGTVWSGLDCTANNPTNCVTVQQRQAFLTVIQEFKNPTDNKTYAGDGFDITAIRDMGSYLFASSLDGFDQDFSRYFLGGRLDWDSDANGIELIRRSNDWDASVRANADPSVLKSSSWTGKVILYTGTADGIVSTNGTRRAFDLAGGTSNQNLKYFEIPGMTHCVDNGNGPAGMQPPWYIGGVGLWIKPPNNRWFMPNTTNIPLNGKESDALAALADWVEKQKASPGTVVPGPTQLVSSSFSDWGTPTVAQQRWVCAKPLRQQFNQGDVTKKESWSCDP